MFVEHKTLQCGGKLVDLATPKVMGILNLTPDSFYDGGHFLADDGAILRQVEKMLTEGAAFVDVGGQSTRPGAETVGAADEAKRVVDKIWLIKRNFPDCLVSVDTFWADVARQAVEAGATLVNDVSAGKMDGAMYETVASLGVPYVLMHMQGTPSTMQQAPSYHDILIEILDFFIAEVGKLRNLGVKDILLDPGFGFGKTVAHNYALLKNLHALRVVGLPILVGVSRKSMICKTLGVSPKNALNGTTALHMVALQQGAKILRAHDVREAVEVIKIWEVMENMD